MILFEAIASGSAGNFYRVSETAANRESFLIDPGISYTEMQEATGYTLMESKFALISHAHGDHCKGAPEFARRGGKCFSTRETWVAGGQKWPCNELAAYWPTIIGIWAVTAFAAAHDVEGATGFSVESNASADKLVYLTDSAYCKHTFKDVTHFAIECNWSNEIIQRNAATGKVDMSRFKRTINTHMSLERLITMLGANDLSKCREIHLLHLSDANSDEKAFCDAVQSATGVPTFVAPTRAKVTA